VTLVLVVGISIYQIRKRRMNRAADSSSA
jgi:hypothetical protein